MRDPIAALVDYNRHLVGGDRDPAWMRAKLDRIAMSPFSFLRGTFHLFVSDWNELGDDPLLAGPQQPVVGDLHLENFGAFRAHDGSYVFDVNDFDETATASPALDLGRLTTSFLLADERHGELRAVLRIESFLEAYLNAVRALDLRPIDGKGMPDTVRDVLTAAESSSRPDWLAERVTGEAGKRRFKASDKYHLVSPETRASVIEAVQHFAASCPDKPDIPDWPTVLDVAVRLAGTGSLGRLRYAVLIQGRSDKPGKERVIELKEALPSSLDVHDEVGQAARVIAYQRQMQGASPAFLGTAQIGNRRFTVRELQPTEAKIDTRKVSAHDLDALCAACGTALGRAHRRVAPGLPERLVGRDRALARRIAAFALRYADLVNEDHARFLKERPAVEKALGL